MNRDTKIKTTFFVVGVLLVLLYGAATTPDELALEEAQYCEMVALYRHDPTTGWPDFRHNYAEVCTPTEGDLAP